MVKEISSLSEFEKEISALGLVVVDFFTTWCGPCKQIAPFIDQLASKYPEVKFIKVDIEKNEDIARPRNITSIPTFQFFVGGKLKDEMKGANPQMLESKVVQLKVDVNPFAGTGFKLAAEPGAAPINAREARLKAFDNNTKKPTPATFSNSESAPAKVPISAEFDEDEALAKALQLSLAESTAANPLPSAPSKASSSSTTATAAAAAASSQEELDFAAAEAEQDAIDRQTAEADDGGWGDEMVPVPVDSALLEQLLDMGFSDVRGRKSIVHGKTLEGALAWLSEHQDDPDIDQPYMVKKSDAMPKKPLTEEEKAQRVLAIKERVKQRRADREKAEKAEELRREKERRERGQKIDETVEERQRMQRKREAEKIKREKAEAEKERQRLRAEIARDKEARKANKGVLPSVLGVDGYNPSIVQYNQPIPSSSINKADSSPSVLSKRLSSETTSSSSSAPPASVAPTPAAPTAAAAAVAVPTKTEAPAAKAVKKPSAAAAPVSQEASPEEKIDLAIATIMRYRTGGDGGQALKLLITFVKNISEHPEEAKYRSINPESNAFKAKLAPLAGPSAILKALGFEKSEEDGKLKAEGDIDLALFASTAKKLEAAELKYRQLNP